VSAQRLPRDVFLGLAVAFVAIRLVGLAPWDQSVDAYAYWSTRDGTLYEGSSVGVLGSYLYSPAFALLIAPVSWLPWNLFNAAWTAMNIGIVWALAGRWSLVALLFLPIPGEIVAGNVHLIYAAVAVFGLRYPVLWVVPLITKVTPGIGLLWFATRREWRNLTIAAAATAAIAAASWVIAPDLWPKYLASLVGVPDNTPWPVAWRLPLAAALVVWGASRNHRWALMVAVFLAIPRWYYLSPVLLVGLFPLVRFARPLRIPSWRGFRTIGLRAPQPAAATSDGLTARAPSS
jgi:hypothetical protein